MCSLHIFHYEIQVLQKITAYQIIEKVSQLLTVNKYYYWINQWSASLEPYPNNIQMNGGGHKLKHLRSRLWLLILSIQMKSLAKSKFTMALVKQWNSLRACVSASSSPPCLPAPLPELYFEAITLHNKAICSPHWFKVKTPQCGHSKMAFLTRVGVTPEMFSKLTHSK